MWAPPTPARTRGNADFFRLASLLAFFEEGQDRRIQPLFKKGSRLAKRKNSAFSQVVPHTFKMLFVEANLIQMWAPPTLARSLQTLTQGAMGDCPLWDQTVRALPRVSHLDPANCAQGSLKIAYPIKSIGTWKTPATPQLPLRHMGFPKGVTPFGRRRHAFLFFRVGQGDQIVGG